MRWPIISLTDEMRDLIDNALANATPCIVGTASKDGEPNVGLKGSVMVFDDESLAFWERSYRGTLDNIEENPRVVVLLRNPEKRVTWPFYGAATVHKAGPIREQVMARVVKPEINRDPERKGYAVVIRVDKVTTLAGEVLQQRD